MKLSSFLNGLAVDSGKGVIIRYLLGERRKGTYLVYSILTAGGTSVALSQLGWNPVYNELLPYFSPLSESAPWVVHTIIGFTAGIILDRMYSTFGIPIKLGVKRVKK